MLGTFVYFRRQSAAFGLVCALWLAGGCATVHREASCGCPDCRTGEGYASRTSNVNVLGKFTNDFHNLVVGSEADNEADLETGPEPVTSRPKRQVASSKPSSDSPSKPKPREAEAKQVAMTTGPTTSQVVSSPEVVMAAPAAPASEPCTTDDNGGCAPGPLVSGPAGRFFPVPAWPVFSPQYGPQYGAPQGGCELR